MNEKKFRKFLNEYKKTIPPIINNSVLTTLIISSQHSLSDKKILEVISSTI